MQLILCPLCESPDAVPVTEVRDRLLGINGYFTIVRCIHCGLHYLNPQPTLSELARYYPESYAPFTTPLPDELPWLQRLSVNYGLRKRCRVVTRYKRSGRLLEIGCARGLFLNAMRQMGNWQLNGVEVSESAVRYARERLGLDVFHGQLQEARFPDCHFDVVVMWDVLEHVYCPRETLLEIRRVLKPDGVLVFRVPVLDSWDRKLFGPYWAGWDAPRHLTLFSLRTLGLMLARTGFCVERTACLSGGYPTFVLSMRFWAQEHLSAPAQKRCFRILSALPVRLLVGPYFYLVDRLSKSTVTTVVARVDESANSLTGEDKPT